MILVALVFFGLMLVGLPIGYVLGVAGTAGLLQVGGENFLAMAPKRFFEGLDLFTFMAMPFFIMAGEIMNRTGITSKIVEFADSLVGSMRGGLAHTNMLASVIFAGMTGAAVSDTAAFGNTLVPAMVKQGYSRSFSCAVTVAGSIIGPTIPPSNLMIIYGSLMGVSIAGMFAAGILPGLLICIVCMIYIAAVGKRKHLPVSDQRFSPRRVVKSFVSGFLALLMPAIILGGIIFGIVTPTEAAAIAVAYAFFLGVVVYRSLTFEAIVQTLIRTSVITGVVFLIIAAASILSWWMTFMQIPQKIATLFLSISRNPQVVISLILSLLLIVGMFMDINAALIILAPVLGPLTAAIGMDPVHAGVMIILSLNISLMTPPVGACLFVISSITGERIERISVELWPFILLEVGVLFLVAFWPSMTLFVPGLLLGK
ncbi:MAG: TRAP transporter large permease [Desulfobacterales bacterium]|jgi:tripartite ATP-independent transporter DctM subunit|nr:TRAP transporter large permease [Desulfobacterales bacterium]